MVYGSDRPLPGAAWAQRMENAERVRWAPANTDSELLNYKMWPTLTG